MKNSDTGLPGEAIGTPTRDYDCVSGFKVCPVGMKYLYTSKTWGMHSHSLVVLGISFIDLQEYKVTKKVLHVGFS